MITENGTVTDMKATVDAGTRTVSFVTTHFSTFALVSESAQPVAPLRLFNPYELTVTHLCTADEEEYESLAEIGWRQEGIAWYGISPAEK
ncbi:hypothetical protein [Thermophilibacter provencensis]|uniref:DUF5648 domain-containing protein n=1 Tax=Thermophilibacter provencensis TaxID=1852386 RepID=A0ABT7V2M7_9ACTN|nr:hypothetical protein [Thermophilibacter provencensis]MDM8270833.1 hypothetical protein [Thermophilibacter provencensis]